MDHAALIDKLTPGEIAARLPNIGRFAVYKWRERRSIPSKHWPELIKLAAEKDIKIGADDLMAGAGAPQPAEQPQDAA